jgi:hypothetical protein
MSLDTASDIDMDGSDCMIGYSGRYARHSISTKLRTGSPLEACAHIRKWALS